MEAMTLLLAAIPTVGSILVAFFASSRSRKAEMRALEIESKSASREDFATVTGAYRALFETAQAEIEALRARITILEAIILNHGGIELPHMPKDPSSR